MAAVAATGNDLRNMFFKRGNLEIEDGTGSLRVIDFHSKLNVEDNNSDQES